mgnify:CR=1 FL=1
MAAFIVCVLVIMFVFGVIFVTDSFGQPIKETLDKLINLNVEEEEDEEEDDDE